MSKPIKRDAMTPHAATKTAPFSMRLDPDMKAVLQKLADSDRRSLTNYVEKVLAEHVKSRDARR